MGISKKALQRALLFMGAMAVYATRANDVSGHTFFSVRPQFASSMPEYVTFFRVDQLGSKVNGWGGNVQVVPFGGRLDPSCGNNLAQYFFPNDRTILTVAEGAAPQFPNADVDARHLNIRTLNQAYASKISINPQQTVAGVGISWRQQVMRCADDSILAWIEVSAPFQRVTNYVNLTEDNINPSATDITLKSLRGLDNAPYVATVTEAFRQKNWKYGKINDGICNTTSGVAFAELKLGFNEIRRDDLRVSTYVGAILSTREGTPTGQYLFEALRGYNGHSGVMYGNAIGFEFWRCDNHVLSLEFENCTRYFFTRSETRTFDLKGKPWSRYMEMYRGIDEAQAAAASATSPSGGPAQALGTSGVNVLTFCTDVSPRYMADFNTAFVYRHCQWIVEAGWHFNARAAEVLSVNFEGNPALKYFEGLGQTTLVRTIAKRFLAADDDIAIPIANYSSAVIKPGDLDINSAAIPSTMSHIVYLTVGYDWPECWCSPVQAGLGGSYEFSSQNTSPDRWLIWFKASVMY